MVHPRERETRRDRFGCQRLGMAGEDWGRVRTDQLTSCPERTTNLCDQCMTVMVPKTKEILFLYPIIPVNGYSREKAAIRTPGGRKS